MTTARALEREGALSTTHCPHGARAPVLATRHPVKVAQPPQPPILPTPVFCATSSKITTLIRSAVRQISRCVLEMA